MNYGFIYCLGNQAMPGIYKIGMTERAPSQRCSELSGATAAPLPFDLLFYGEVQNPGQTEREIHAHFELERVSPSREFFRGTAQGIHTVFKEWCDSIAVTNDGGYYMSVESIINQITQAHDDAERIRLMCSYARIEGIVMWQEAGRIKFNVPTMEMVPRWILMVAATCKSMLLQHLADSFQPKPKLVIAASSPEVSA
jgi:hypothetical protein